MRRLALTFAMTAALTLTACGGSDDPSPDAEGAAPVEQGAGPVEVGGSFTYPDGLVVSVGEWREEATGSPNPPRVMKLDLTATNPTGEVVETTQAWVLVRAGDTGEELTEWAFDSSLDAVLQPGAEATATYSYDVPETPGHVTATVSWLEAEGDHRPDVDFLVEE